MNIRKAGPAGWEAQWVWAGVVCGLVGGRFGRTPAMGTFVYSVCREYSLEVFHYINWGLFQADERVAGRADWARSPLVQNIAS